MGEMTGKRKQPSKVESRKKKAMKKSKMHRGK